MARLNRKQQQDKRELLSSLNHMNNCIGSKHAAENQAFQCTDINGSNGMDETDLLFLEGILDNPAVTQKFKVEDKFHEEHSLKPVQLDNRALCRSLAQRLSRARNTDARELSRLLSKSHFKALIETHDDIGARALEPRPPIDPRKILSKEFIEATEYGMPGAETIRIVGLRRKQNEPLGMTVEVDEHNQLMIARILAGGMIDQQALLRPGDVILEVNGVPVSSPEQLQDQIMLAKESITLKIGPSVDEEMKSARLLMSGGGQVKNDRNLDTGKKLTLTAMEQLKAMERRRDHSDEGKRLREKVKRLSSTAFAQVDRQIYQAMDRSFQSHDGFKWRIIARKQQEQMEWE